MPVSGAQFRHTLSHLAAGVTVVVVRDGAGRWHGMTASAVTSLSLEPPMVLVCVGYEATIHNFMVSSPHFGITVLAESQAAVAERFADRNRHQITEEMPLSPGGIPLLGGIAHLDLTRDAVHAGGDHSIVLGTVDWSDVPGGEPLLYFRSRYGAIQR